MTDSMIETVARAINPDAFRDDYQERYIFKAWQDDAKSKALRDARAAIEAMREPTEAMVEAGTETITHTYDRDRNGYLQDYQAVEAWGRMIDAALSEEPK